MYYTKPPTKSRRVLKVYLRFQSTFCTVALFCCTSLNMDSEKPLREFLISHFPLQNKTTNQETKNPPSVLHLKHRSSLFFLITFILNLIKSFRIAVHLGFFLSVQSPASPPLRGTLPYFSTAPGGACRSWPPSWCICAGQALHLLITQWHKWKHKGE